MYVEFLTKDDYPLGGVSTDDQHQALGAERRLISNHVDLGRRLSEQVQGVLPRGIAGCCHITAAA